MEGIDEKHALGSKISTRNICICIQFLSNFTSYVIIISFPAPENPIKRTSMSTWLIGPIKSPTLVWGERKANNVHQCPFCHILLLTGERPGFCCGKDGQYLITVPPLPPLPEQYAVFLDDPQISSLSRILNLIFSFASLETTHQFPDINGPPGFVAIQGHVYHQVRPSHSNSAVHWFLYDSFIRDKIPHSE